ncbi:MAG: caspase family protein [Campylobacterota bacterium]|nr:caspase family protein [Campylobacterota bacterium]
MIKLVSIIIILLFTTTTNAITDRSLKMMKSEQRVALVIGNNNYNSDRLSKLKNPINDAKAMSTKLKSLGFKVYYGENLSVRAMDKKLRSFSSKLSAGGVGLFFFAGHGIEHSGKNYLMGKDSNLVDKDDIAYESLELNKVIDKMKNSGNRLNIVLLDACRNDPFSRSGGGGLAKVDNAKGMFIAYATSPGDEASDGSGKHGVFTKQILKHIDENGVTLNKLFKNIKRDVYNKTNQRQRPWTHDDIIGEFFFTLPTNTALGTSNSFEAKKPKNQSSFSFKNEAPTTFSLTINPTPRDAKVSITNIKPKYYDGIRLKKGSYIIKVSKSGYITKKGKVDLEDNFSADIVLEKIIGISNSFEPSNSKKIYKEKDTGLIWQVDVPNREYKWSDAKDYCRDLTLAGYSNWKLPNRDELKSIVTKKSYKNSKSNTGKTYIKKPLLESMNMEYQWFWSATEKNSSTAWTLRFGNGNVDYGNKSHGHYVRCVVGRQ